MPVRLSQLSAGQLARLHCAELNAHDCALLQALGLTDRCVMRVCKIGEPCIVQVRATRIGLSRSVADGILVVPESAG
jgi:Fe2+ transport system protein FeoA